MATISIGVVEKTNKVNTSVTGEERLVVINKSGVPTTISLNKIIDKLDDFIVEDDLLNKVEDNVIDKVEDQLDEIVEDAINNLFLITFDFGDTEYKAEEGMTWEEWVNSKYNTGGWKINNNYILAKGGTLYYANREEIMPWYVYKNDKINNLETYCIYGGSFGD